MQPTKTIALSLALILGASVAANAAAPAKRVEEGNYTGGGVQGAVGISGSGQEDVGAVRFEGGSERRVEATVEDATGRPVVAEIVQLSDPGQPPLVSHVFCGETNRPTRVWPHREVHVYVYYGQGCDGEVVSAPTRGTITAIFTRR